MVNEDETYSHAELNEKFGKRGRFFESEADANGYRDQYKKKHPFKFCVIYPMRDAIMVEDVEKTKAINDGQIYYTTIGYKRIGFLVGTPE